MNRFLVGLGLLGLLAGCSVKEVGPEPGAELLDPDTKLYALDPDKLFLADRSATMEELGGVLAAVGKNHAYHEWTAQFIEETIEEVKKLAPGEILEDTFYTESSRGLDEVKIRLIKAEGDKAVVRLIVSDSGVAEELQADLDGALVGG